MKEKIIGSRYQVLKYIAQGGFGRTYLAKDTQLPGQDLCVVKQLSPTTDTPNFLQLARRLFKTEAKALNSLGHHEQIPELLAYFEESEKFYLVQQYIEGKTIEEELQIGHPWSETQVINLLQDCLKILDFIHQKNVIHRDLKPANLIRRHSDQKIVLVDFGTVKNVLKNSQSNSQLTVAIGTKGYMPPEQARGLPLPSSDLYALGMIAIEVLTRIEPLELEEDDYGDIKWTHLAQVKPPLAKILTKMTRYHCQDRYQSAQEALQALNIFTDAGKTKPQSITTINQSVSEGTSTDYSNKIAISETSPGAAVNKIATPSLASNNKLPSQNQHDQISSPIKTPNVEIKPISQPAEPVLTPKKVTAKKIPFLNLAIALVAIMLGGIYIFRPQTPEESPTIPDSSTPRINQRGGFRDDL